MSVPTYDQFIEPILRFLAARPEGATASEAHEAAAMTLGLSEAAAGDHCQWPSHLQESFRLGA